MQVIDVEEGRRTITALVSISLVIVLAALLAENVIELIFVCSSLCLIPLLMFATFKGLSGDRTYGTALSVILLYVIGVNFRFREYTDKGIDLQVGLKLAAVAGFAILSLISWQAFLKRDKPACFIIWFLFFTYMCFTALYAENPLLSIIYSTSLLVGYVFLSHLCFYYGQEWTIKIALVACFCLCLSSIVVYFVIPSFGRMSDWIGNSFTVTNRLQGVFGSSNGAGSSAAVGLLLTITSYNRGQKLSFFYRAVFVISMALCVLLSNNRMAIFGLIVAGSVLFLTAGNFARRLLFLCALALVGSAVLGLFAEAIFTGLSRSGSAEEIASGTGRTRIWEVVLELWRDRPLFGLGYASAQQILPIHPKLFLAAAHTHNLYLEVLFSGGILGIALFGSALITTIQFSISHKAYRELSLLSFFLVYGFTEPVIGGFISFPTLCLLLAITLVASRPRFASSATSPIALSGVRGGALRKLLRSGDV